MTTNCTVFCMELDPSLIPPQTPFVSHPDIPKLGQQRIGSALSALHQQALTYSSGVALRMVAMEEAQKIIAQCMLPEESTGRPRTSGMKESALWRSWAMAGCRSAVMSAHDCVKVFEQLRAILNSIDQARMLVDLKRFKDILRRLENLFPQSRLARDSAGHPELFLKEDFSVKSGLDSPDLKIKEGVNFSLQDVMVGNEYTSTFNGQIVKAPITFEAAAELVKIVGDIFDVVKPLDHAAFAS